MTLKTKNGEGKFYRLLSMRELKAENRKLCQELEQYKKITQRIAEDVGKCKVLMNHTLNGKQFLDNCQSIRDESQKCEGCKRLLRFKEML